MDELDVKFEEILDCFDFQKVHMIMDKLGWTWGMDSHSPSVEEMKKSCRELFKYTKKSHGKSDYEGCSSGGFKVTRYTHDNRILLEFILEDAEYDPEVDFVY